jgi:hypothetical protein
VVAVVGFIDLRAGREVWGSSVVRWMGLMGRTELDIFVLESCVGFVLLLGEWSAWGLFFGGACWRWGDVVGLVGFNAGARNTFTFAPYRGRCTVIQAKHEHIQVNT